MKKAGFIFIATVLLPSLVLAWLAAQSVQDHGLVLERQRTFIAQEVCQKISNDLQDFWAGQQRRFKGLTDDLLSQYPVEDLAHRFDDELLKAWPLAEVGFAASLDGPVFSPSLVGRAASRRFRLENDLFLCSRESVEVYWNSPKGAINLTQMDAVGRDAATSESKKSSSPINRKVAPQKESDPDGKPYSKVTAAEGEFKKLVGDSEEGSLARFLQNNLTVFFWRRVPSRPNIVFGAQINLPLLTSQLRQFVQAPPDLRDQFCFALLNENGTPVAQSHSQFQGEWRRPFVSIEMGEILPHWEVAAYALRPAQLEKSARLVSTSVWSLALLLLFAIGIGGWLIVADLSRQTALARQKTDFVSNVSHELKTPLTSIRMFSELLAEGRVSDPEKQRSYLQIITAETARLTRLINNVLDFSRLERGEKNYQFERCDLAVLARQTLDRYSPHLQSQGFHLEFNATAEHIHIRADCDAIAQILLNLISNAEKYSAGAKEIKVEVCVSGNNAELHVLDRGSGVPTGAAEKIFEQFYRAHDSLSSGIQGSGLGLTLARQIARAHQGDVFFTPREGGGSRFILRLPLDPVQS